MADEQYYSVFTEKGLELITQAIQHGTKLGITHMSFGDGSGVLPSPDPKLTKLVNEVYKTPLNSLSVDPKNKNWLRAEAVIASAVGGFNIRELGLYADDILVAYSNYPPTYKPNPADGTARIMTFRMVLQIDNVSNFELIIDPDIVLATIEYVDKNSTKKIASVNELKTTTPKIGQVVDLISFHENKNIGGGQFICMQSALLTEDDGIVFRSKNIGFEDYFWVRINFNEILPEFFGAKGNDRTFDSGPALQKAFLKSNVVLLDRIYYSNQTLYHRSNFSLKGAGASKSKIIKLTTNQLDIADIDAPDKAGKVSYRRDATLIALPENGDYAKDINIEGVYVGKEWTGDENDGYFLTGIAYFAPYLAQSTFKDLRCAMTEYGIYTTNVWMVNWTRVEGQAKSGWVLGGLDGDLRRGGTSNTFNSCWSMSAREGYFAWNIHNLGYSTFSGTGSDAIGKDGKPAAGVWKITESEITISQTCVEASHVLKLFYIRGSFVEINGISFFDFHNKYGGKDNYLIDIGSYSEVSFDKGKYFFNYNLGDSNHAQNIPNFLKSDWSSNTVYKKNNLTYPRLTGFNNDTRFQIAVANNSSIEAETNGYTYIRNLNQTNTAYPTAPGKLLDTDQGLRTSGEVTSSSVRTGEAFGLTAPTGARWNTSLFRLGSIRIWYSPTYQKFFWKGSNPESETDGQVLGREEANLGFKSGRPTDKVYLFPGRVYFDQTLAENGKPIWWTGKDWVDATGAIV